MCQRLLKLKEIYARKTSGMKKEDVRVKNCALLIETFDL